MVESITAPPAPEGGYGPRFLEIHPSIDSLPQMMPCAAISGVQCRNSMPDRTRMDYIDLPARNEADGTVTTRRLRRHFLQDYRYRIQFYLTEPEPEILSDDERRSVVDQCLIFISENQRTVNEQHAVIRIEAGESGLDTSLAEDGIYSCYLDVILHDAYYSVGEINRMPARDIKTGRAEVRVS
jgi:hypothetical protein